MNREVQQPSPQGCTTSDPSSEGRDLEMEGPSVDRATSWRPGPGRGGKSKAQTPQVASTRRQQSWAEPTPCSPVRAFGVPPRCSRQPFQPPCFRMASVGRVVHRAWLGEASWLRERPALVQPSPWPVAVLPLEGLPRPCSSPHLHGAAWSVGFPPGNSPPQPQGRRADVPFYPLKTEGKEGTTGVLPCVPQLRAPPHPLCLSPASPGVHSPQC